jgi:predicted acyltransferase
MLILATSMADLYFDAQRSQRGFLVVSLSVLAAGLAATLLVPISKDRASASYILVSLGLSGITFYIFHLLARKSRLKLPILTDWGRNPLLLYLLHYVILAIYFLPPIPIWYVQAPFWLVVLQLGVMIGILSWIGHYLNQHKIYFVL